LSQHEFHTDTIPICDYEGSDYRSRFWTNQGREYEDLAERIAIRRLLPHQGRQLLEVGTGFGRLVDLYQGYQHLVLLDYSKSMLKEAQERLGQSPKYTYVAASLYQMPLVDGLFDTACMVRVMHHVANVPGALRQIHRVVRPGGIFVLEFASKLHLKSVLRYVVRRQSWSPFVPNPVEFAALNFDFHPRWMRDQLRRHGFAIQRLRSVSRFRVPLLKRIIPPRTLAWLDGALQWLGSIWQFTPSVFVRARREGGEGDPMIAPGTTDPTQLFRCPACEQHHWHTSETELRCLSCGKRWGIDDGIYDFKSPIQGPPSE
jgi:ubiquinone/menaquinone biosynthesis C-methylase UbiE